ncbi:MAG: efflux RND transporter periplasmic adaptor subunit [Nitrospirae bacterium]|nr:efflux RND transporter periplasmic adaptor subunit [Nitrospirota bacterium]MBF0542281.1 efflux RND transporter periplasmic adaptor subunit [Nitrospirota bacterium]
MRIIFIIIIICLFNNNAFAERKIKYWVEPMDPTYIRDKPGKSPMGMDLVPVYEDEAKQDKGVITIDANTSQNIGVRTAKITKGVLNTSIRTVGNITYDEKRVKHVHTKISGWVEKLYVDTTGEAVKKGQPILTIYSPELVATQNEYLQALLYKGKIGDSSYPDIANGADSLLEATRKRLLLMDINESQIKDIEKNGQITREMTLFSPLSGVVIMKNVFEGLKIDPSVELYTIADLSSVWIIASVYEYEIPFLKIGQEAVITLSYEPGIKYKGKVTFIYPFLDALSRTVQVRIELKNPGLKLKPDMYTNVELITKSKQGSKILVPSEAVLRTGTRSIVITELSKGKFQPKEVKLGSEGNGLIEVLAGLKGDETIVTSGQFLIDSESNLKEAVNKMLETKNAPPKTDELKSKESNIKPLDKTTLTLTNDQQLLVSNISALYLEIHQALTTDSANIVSQKALKMSDIIVKLLNTKPDKPLMDFINGVKGAIPGMASGEIKKERDAFILLSKIMVPYARGAGDKDLNLKGTEIYICTMTKERWVQHAGVGKNPFLGKDMTTCAVKDK